MGVCQIVEDMPTVVVFLWSNKPIQKQLTTKIFSGLWILT